MLYERWRQIARENQRELALHDLASGRHWTFAELAMAVEARVASDGPVAFPRGASPDFVLTVLRAWRDGRVVCPLEVDQSPPVLSGVPRDCIHIKMTSASTGASRAIAFTAAQLMADVENIVATMNLQSAAPNLGVISLAHSYGFSNLILPLLLHGIPLILAQSALPECIRSAGRLVSRITLPGVPALWRAWHEANALSSSIVFALSAGAPLPLALEKEIFEKRGLKIHNFYGASECGGIAFDGSNVPREDAGCVGAPMKNVSLRIGEEGCLEVRGNAVGQTYWPESNEALANGSYKTSDLARISGGLVYLHGRATDQINVAGRKIAPEVIERALLGHEGVRECLVFGVPSSDRERSETIVAAIALRNGTTEEALRDFLLSRLPAWQVPRAWWLVEALQVNDRGKLSRAEWRRRYLERVPKSISG
jgi:long-chain acyl-CoA synthetase